MLSIILSTYNGAKRLPGLFESFFEQEGLSAINFEFIVVDNASNDETLGIIENYRANKPWIRYVKEEKLGLNYARNRGVSEAKGEILIFIDDDITFSNTWLFAYHNLFISNPNALLAGGKVTCSLSRNIEKPKWLDMDGEFSFPYITVSVDYGDSVKLISLEGGTMPVGANMAFRRKVIEEFGVFRTDFGLKGKSLMPGAEFEYFNRLRQKELKWFYVPNANVFHPVKSSQLCQSYFLKRTFGVGRVAAKTMIIPAHTRKLGPIPIFCFRLLLESIWKYIHALPSCNSSKCFFRKAQIYKMFGLIYEWVNPRIN